MKLKRVSGDFISGMCLGVEWVSEEEVREMEDEYDVDHDEYGCPCLIVDLFMIRLLFVFESSDA